jgi:hypothetical protein
MVKERCSGERKSEKKAGVETSKSIAMPAAHLTHHHRFQAR